MNWSVATDQLERNRYVRRKKYRIIIGALNNTVKETVSSNEWTTEQLRLLDDLSNQVVHSIMISERN